MRVRLRTGFAGHGFYWKRGSIADVPDGDAERMIARGLAEPVGDGDLEAAVKTPAAAENAATRTRPGPAKTPKAAKKSAAKKKG